MDIIIRNGTIDKPEAKRIREIKNEEGLLKKNYTNFIKGIPGPYYDLLNIHICVPRRANMIPNFFGPQESTKIKLIENSDKVCYKSMYCSICHKLIKPNTSFSSKRKVLVPEFIFQKKPNESDKLTVAMKKVKIDEIQDSDKKEIKEKELDELNEKLYGLKLKILNNKWSELYNNFYHNNVKKALKEKQKQNTIVNRFSKLCFKLKQKPVEYDISIFETRMIKPWNLTPYQKFRLQNPDYKNSPLFSHQKNNKIRDNFVTID